MAVKKQVEAVDITLVKSAFTNKQMEKLLAPTNKRHIKTKPGSGSYSYVTSYYVTTMLNHVFGYRWDFETLEDKTSEITEKGVKKQLISIKGRLTITTETGLRLSREQYGSSSNAKDPYKSAASDALKKCASLFGVAQDVYSQVEGREYEIVDSEDRSNNVELESVINFMLTHVKPEDRADFMRTAAYLKYQTDKTITLIVKSWNS